MTPYDQSEQDALVDDVRSRALGRGVVVAVAESLTGGALAQALARGQDAEQWFAGGVVAYRNPTKYRALDVPEGPVVTREAARAMAEGVLRLTDADVAVSVTGVGGPGPEEGQEAGTVFICAATRTASFDFVHSFDGDPESVVECTVRHALRHLVGALLEVTTRASARVG